MTNIQTQENKMFETALQIALSAHLGQTDKCGLPYILHPLAVAAQMPSLKLKTIALLHDTIEDADVTPEYLFARGMPDYVVDAVKLLTKPAGANYEEYLMAIKTNQLALAVKRADLAHNTSPERVAGLNEHRKIKYELAKKILTQ